MSINIYTEKYLGWAICRAGIAKNAKNISENLNQNQVHVIMTYLLTLFVRGERCCFY